MTRLGDLLDFGQLFNASGNKNMPKSLTFIGNFWKGFKIYPFSSEVILGNFYRHLAIFSWSHWKQAMSVCSGGISPHPTSWTIWSGRCPILGRIALSMRFRKLDRVKLSENWLIQLLGNDGSPRLNKQCDQICRDFALWQNLTSLWQFFDSLVFIWQNVKYTLANLQRYWANFLCW